MARARLSKRSRKMRRSRMRSHRKSGNKLALSRSVGGVIPQTCRIQETIDFEELQAGLSYYNGFTISQFKRASALSIYFRFYKPLKVIWTYEPKFNTFQQNSTGDTVGMPYLYYAMNRTQDNHIYTLQDIQAQGARPHKFSSKKVISYVPNWCSPGLQLVNSTTYVQPGTLPPGGAISNVAVQGLKTEYGFNQCPGTLPAASTVQVPVFPSDQPNLAGVGSNPSMVANYAGNVLYNGHDLFIQQDNAVSGVTLCKISCTVIWEFKGPNNTTGVSSDLSQNIIQPYNWESESGF